MPSYATCQFVQRAYASYGQVQRFLVAPVQAAEYVIGVFAGAYGIASGVDVAGIVTPLRHPFEADEAAGISLCFHLIIYGVCRIIAVDIDKIRGLGLGADDYMTKPFSPNELVARVKAHISRYDTLTSKSGDVITVGKLMIDKDAHKVTVDGKEISLTAKEYDLLLFLAENPNHTFSKEVLFDRIWGMDAIGDVSTVTVHIQRVRDKINTENERYIETIWGVGYRFNI